MQDATCSPLITEGDGCFCVLPGVMSPDTHRLTGHILCATPHKGRKLPNSRYHWSSVLGLIPTGHPEGHARQAGSSVALAGKLAASWWRWVCFHPFWHLETYSYSSIICFCSSWYLQEQRNLRSDSCSSSDWPWQKDSRSQKGCFQDCSRLG